MARFGGEEFCAILPESDIDGGVAFAERIRTAIEALKVKQNNEGRAVTVSLGVSSMKQGAADTSELLSRADKGFVSIKACRQELRHRFQIRFLIVSASDCLAAVESRKPVQRQGFDRLVLPDLYTGNFRVYLLFHSACLQPERATPVKYAFSKSRSGLIAELIIRSLSPCSEQFEPVLQRPHGRSCGYRSLRHADTSRTAVPWKSAEYNL